MKISKNLAIIPAKAASKGIPNKNIGQFCGKPLIYYTISQAIKCRIFDRVIVDTDSLEVADIAKKYGAETPYLRPKKLATDNSGIVEVALHLIERLKGDGYSPRIITLLQTTSPLREINDIKKCYELISSTKVESVCTVCETHPRLYYLNPSGLLRIANKKIVSSTNRQDWPKGYMLNGCMVYMVKAAFFQRHKSFVTNRTYGVVCPKWRSVDLDEVEDWIHAETLYKNKELIKRKIDSFQS